MAKPARSPTHNDASAVKSCSQGSRSAVTANHLRNEAIGPRIPLKGSLCIFLGMGCLCAALLTTILPSGIMGVEAAVTSAESGGSAHTTPFQQLWNSFAMPQVVQEYYDYFATEEGRKLVWGITIRLLAVVWIISLGSLIPQIVPMHGKDGYDPCCRKFEHLSKMWPSWNRFISIPTLLWFTNNDVMLRLVPTLGLISAALAVGGGIPTWGITSTCLLGFTWVMALSIDKVVGLMYPWDCLLLESGILALFLPNLRSVILPVTVEPGSNWIEMLSTEEAPNGLAVFMFRYLLFRLMFGFGKLKFMDTLPKDDLYVKYFYINMPMTSPIGFFGHFLPDIVHIASLKLMWISEMPAPFFFLLSGWSRILAAVGTICLQIGIQATGNFGYFNVLTAVLCISALDHQSDLLPYLATLLPNEVFSFVPASIEPLWKSFLHLIKVSLDALPRNIQHFGDAVVTSLGLIGHYSLQLLGMNDGDAQHVVSSGKFEASTTEILLVLFFFAVTIPASINIMVNSWCALGWQSWPGLRKLRPQAVWGRLFAYLRLITPFRINHAYGVFPPNSAPARRWCPVFEGSYDGEVWRQFHLPYMINDSKSKPVFVAPHHPRVDHAIFYESLGSDGHGFNCSVGSGDPLTFSRSGPWLRLQAKLLEGAKSDVYRIFANNPFPNPEHPPRYVRVSSYCYKPLNPSHALSTGEYWDVTRAGTHLPAMTIDDTQRVWDDWLVEPERFHPDHIIPRESMKWTSSGVSVDEYEEAWHFIGFLREVALDIAREDRGQNGDSGNSSRKQIPKRRKSISKIRQHNGAANQESSAYPFVDPRSILPDIELPDVIPVGVEGPLDPAMAAKLFNWATLPYVWRKATEKYSHDDLLRIEGTLGKMAAPLRAKHEALFHRPSPIADEVEKEIEHDIALQKSNPLIAVETNPVWNTKALRLEAEEGRLRLVTDDDFGGERWKAYASNRRSDERTEYVKETFSTPGKDWETLYRCLPDVTESPGEGCPPDCAFMSSAFRVGLYSDWYMLVGGRNLYERAVDGESSIVGGHRLPTIWPLEGQRPWKSNASDHQIDLESRAEHIYQRWGGGNISLGHLFRQTNSPFVNIAGTTLQSLLFIKSVFFYQSFASLSTKAKVMQKTLRPEMKEVAGGFLPGWLDVNVLLKDWPALRMWDHRKGDWIEPMIAPEYDLHRDDPHWVETSDGTKEAGRQPDGQDVIAEYEVRQSWSEEERRQWEQEGRTPPRIRREIRKHL